VRERERVRPSRRPLVSKRESERERVRESERERVCVCVRKRVGSSRRPLPFHHSLFATFGLRVGVPPAP